MPETAPPTQQQAEAAQQARFTAELAILALFQSGGSGGGEGENDDSILHTIEIAAIIAILSSAILSASFRDLRDQNADTEKIGEDLAEEAQDVFTQLQNSELTDEQRSVLWATWAYSRTADTIAEALADGFPGRTLKKVWISRSDAKVRALHAKLHGKAIPSSEDFWRWPVTGQRLRWPGDLDAPPEATIGCRCVCLLTWANQDEVSSTIRKIVLDTAPPSL